MIYNKNNAEFLFSTLKNNSDFSRVKTSLSSKKYVLPAFIVQAQIGHVNNNTSVNTAAQKSVRIGYIASKKVGGAVLRNKAKRIMRSIVRKHLFSFSIEENMDIIIIAKRTILDRKFFDLEKDFRYFMHQLVKDKDT